VIDPFMINIATVPNFLLYFFASLILLLAYIASYTAITPHREFALIRAGNVAAAISLSGALIGFALPLASAVIHSSSLIDMLMWGVIALVVQATTFLVIRIAQASLCEDIAEGKVASGTLLAAASLVVGILNAACITY
jgi:putative membrane protein